MTPAMVCRASSSGSTPMATISTPAGIIKTSVTPTTIGIVSNAHFHWNPAGAGAGGVAEGVAAVGVGMGVTVENTTTAAVGAGAHIASDDSVTVTAVDDSNLFTGAGAVTAAQRMGFGG